MEEGLQRKRRAILPSKLIGPGNVRGLFAIHARKALPRCRFSDLCVPVLLKPRRLAWCAAYEKTTSLDRRKLPHTLPETATKAAVHPASRALPGSETFRLYSSRLDRCDTCPSPPE